MKTTNGVKTKLSRVIRQTNNNSTTKHLLIEGGHKLGNAYGSSFQKSLLVCQTYLCFPSLTFM